MNPEMFQCPICQNTLLDPRTLSCGHTYCGQINGLEKPCIDYLLKGEVIICAMDNQQFPVLKLSDIRTNIILRDTIEDYKRNKRNKCPTHVNKNLDLVCLTCGGMRICTGCMKVHRGHDMTSAADHFQEKMTEIDNEVDEKTRMLEERLANREKVLEKLTRLTEDVRRDREEIGQSLEKLRSLKLQSQQIRQKAQLIQSEDVEAYLEQHRSVQLGHSVHLHSVKKTCQEVVQLLDESHLIALQSMSSPMDCSLPVTHDRLASQSTPTLIYPVIGTDQEPSAPPLAQLPDDGCPSSSSVVSVTPDISSSRSAPESSGAVKEFLAEHSISPQFTSAREVVKCYSISCVDDLIFVATKDHHVIKYRWGESGGKISINEVKKRSTINCGHSILAATKTQDRVRLYACTRLYVCNNAESTVERCEQDSLKHLNTLNTDKLDGRKSWRIAAWEEVLTVSDDHVICMYKDDQLVTTVPNEHWVRQIRLSPTFLATWIDDWQIRVMRWGGDRLDLTPVYTIERTCLGLAMSERLLLTSDWGNGKLVSLDLTTMEERQLKCNVGRFYPNAFAREDLVVGTNEFNRQLIMMHLS